MNSKTPIFLPDITLTHIISFLPSIRHYQCSAAIQALKKREQQKKWSAQTTWNMKWVCCRIEKYPEKKFSEGKSKNIVKKKTWIDQESVTIWTRRRRQQHLSADEPFDCDFHFFVRFMQRTTQKRHSGNLLFVQILFCQAIETHFIYFDT